MWCHTTLLYAVPYYYMRCHTTICGAILLHYMWCHITPLYVVPYYFTIYGAILLHCILLHYMWYHTTPLYVAILLHYILLHYMWWRKMCEQNSTVQSGHITRGAFGIDHCKVLSFCFVYYSICIVTFDPFPRPPPDFIFLSDEMRHLRDKIYPWEQYFTAVWTG